MDISIEVNGVDYTERLVDFVESASDFDQSDSNFQDGNTIQSILYDAARSTRDQGVLQIADYVSTTVDETAEFTIFSIVGENWKILCRMKCQEKQ